MRSRAVVTAVMLAMMILMPRLAGAVGVHYFDCKECHKTGMAITQLGDSNVCRQCHNAPTVPTSMNSGATVDPGTGFLAGDASNVYGTAQPTGNHTSHQFAAPSDVVAAAGAQAPSRTTASAFYTRYGSSHGKVTCSRCHNPHGDATTNPLLLVTGADTTNQMCLACHVDFDKSANHGLVTHPLVADYAATVTAVNDTYKVAHPAWTADDLPYKTVPDNGATNGNVSLVAGGVSCTSCHAVHFADSDASTTDNFGATAAGDGYLLKHNGPAREDPLTPGAGDSICQTCHNYQGHSLLTTHPIGCQVCHGGHAYDAGGSPNYYMLNKTITIDSAITPNPNDGPGDVTVNLDYTALDSKWMDGGAGYCEGCHDLGANHNGLTVGDSQTGCVDCHNHDQGTFTGGGCNTCHGYSPSSDTPGGPTGYAVDPDVVAPADSYKMAAGVVSPKNESLTAHLKHADQLDVGTGNYKFACTECHANYGTGHRDGNFQDVAFDALASGGGLTPAVYNPAGTGTCATLYCHSNGRAAATAATIPAWQGGAIADCAQCHGNDAASMTSKGNTATHQAHLAKGYSCNVCHDGTAASNTTLASTAISGKLHVNGSADILFDNAFDLGAALLGAGASGGGTCSIYCHSNGTTQSTPDWNVAGSGACGSCHQYNNAGTATGSGAVLSGAHAKHVFDAAGPGLACTACHTNAGSGADHVNGEVSLVANACNTCHGATVAGTGVDAEPVWTVAASVSCETCHLGTLAVVGGKTAPAKDNALTSGHGLASGNYTVSGNAAANQACASCHDSAAAGHFDGVSGDDARLQGAFSCGSCHGTLVTHQAATCVTCHDPHGSSNIYMVKATSPAFSGTVVFSATSGADSYDEVDASNGDDICATCHTAGNQTNQHNNKTNSGVAHNEGADCFNCHLSHATPGNAFAVGGGDSCDSCHGFPPATAAHALHAPDSFLTDAGGKVYDTADRSACEFCHTGAASYTYNTATDQGNSLNHSNASGRATILAASIGYNGSTCASACHDGASGLSAAWTDAALACDACHYESATPSLAGNDADPNPLSGSHSTHFATSAVCTDCHGTLPTDTTHITDRSGANEIAKVQGMATAISFEATLDATALGSTGVDPTSAGTNANCNNTACHNPSAATYSAEWTVANAVGCAFCHSATDPATGSHDEHMGATTTFGLAVACTSCHGTLPVSNSHLNKVVNFAAGMNYTAGAEDVGGTLGSCSTSTCHNDGTAAATAVPTPTWNTLSANCSICHSDSPTSNKHGVHLASTNYVTGSCGDCHSAANTATHINGTRDLANKVTSAILAADGTCATTCHAVVDGRDWTAGPTLDCADCHGATGKTLYTASGAGGWPNTSNKHAAHTGSNALPQTGSSDCFACHNGTVDNTGALIGGGSHLNTTFDVAFNSGYNFEATTAGKAGTGAATTCSNIRCHSGVTTPAWAAASSISCGKCHNTSGTGPLPSGSTLGSHAKHANNDGDFADCAQCHTGANSYSATGGLSAHQNLVVNVGVSFTYTDANGAAGVNYSGDGVDNGSCATSCHGASSPGWGTAGAVTCTSCHNNGTDNGVLANAVPAATATIHTTHNNANNAYVPSDCDACHGAGAQTATHSGHINGSATVANKVTSYTDATGTCANNCHNVTDGRDWTSGISLACSDCHIGAGALDLDRSASPPNSDKHPAHVATMDSAYGSTARKTNAGGYDFACGQCHGSTLSNHLNFNIDVAAATNFNLGSCSTNVCHNDGRGGAPVEDPNWTTGFTAGGDICGKCHANSPATAAHSVHAVGIHASDIYTGTTGLQSASASAPSAHGDGATSTVISCNSCHNDTVNDWFNANNPACASCHTTGGTGGDQALVITGFNSHVNGTRDVVFQNIAVKSRAQVRDDITTVTDLTASWTRTNGYKANNSYDVAKNSLNTASYNAGTCSAVACHNGNDATWAAPQNNCLACHTGLPK